MYIRETADGFEYGFIEETCRVIYRKKGTAETRAEALDKLNEAYIHQESRGTVRVRASGDRSGQGTLREE